ncbi:PDR/VanB family oxidoreductase [soil metagenome]
MADEIRNVVVTRRRDEARGVVSLELGDATGAALPHWTPGSHIDLILPNGLTRQYSLCGDREGDRWMVAVLHEPEGRGGSAWIHDTLQEGDSLQVRGPRNHFELSKALRYILVAGGVGITPIVAMVRELESTGIKDWKLVYGGSSRSSMAFADELAALGDRVQIVPADEHGLIDIDAALGEPSFGAGIYCCGPEPLLKAVERASRSWAPGTLHVERFVAKQVDTSSDRPFEVEAVRSGLTLTVEAHESILEALEAQGVMITSSCGEGVCGTCETKVLEGAVEHRDALLTESERESNTVMMVCCSRARGDRLVLDV